MNTAHQAAKELDRRLSDWKLAYRIDEVSAATGYGKTKLWKLIKAGLIKAKKDGGVTFVLRADLQSYLESVPDRN